MLSVNDRMVAQFGNSTGLELIRLGLPNAFAGNLLPPIVGELRSRNGDARLQICCDGSNGLLRSIRCGYLDIAFAFGDTDSMVDAVRSWPEELVWARSPTLQYRRDNPGAADQPPRTSSSPTAMPWKRWTKPTSPIRSFFPHSTSAPDAPARSPGWATLQSRGGCFHRAL